MGQRVAVDVDALDVSARAFGDVEGDLHRPRFGIAAEFGIDVGKGITEQTGGLAQALDRVLDQLGVVPIVLLHRQQRLEHFGLEVAQLALHVDVAKLVALAFLDDIRDDEILLVAGQLGDRRNDAEIGVAVLQVKQAELLLVIGQTIGIVAGVRRQDRQQARLLGRHFVLQVAVAELLVAEDADLANLRLRSFVDFEHDIDAVLVERHHLGLDGRSEAALTLVQLDDAGDVGADFRAGEDLARRELDLGPDLVFLQALVALQDHAVDHRVFGDLDRQRTIIVGDLKILEQLGRGEVFQGLIKNRAIIALTNAQPQVRQDRLRFEPLVADDGDRLDRRRGRRRFGGGCGDARSGNWRRRNLLRHHRRTEHRSCHKEGRQLCPRREFV